MAGHQKKKKAGSGQKLLTGRIQLTRSGMGYVTVAGMEQDVLVRREHTGSALDGDEVSIEITREGSGKSSRHAGRTAGVVRKVISRKQEEFTGVLDVKERFAFLTADNQNMTVDIFVPIDKLNGAVDGDRALVRITDWAEDRRNPAGEVLHILTQESANEIAMQGILSEAGFPLHFPDEVIEEAARFTDAIDAHEVKKRRDLRGTLTLTIDPKDARDFDDAISLRTLKNGNHEIGVHIADVSHFVEEGSALDKEAARRATSVYLPDRVLPMLPEHLSNLLCSLRPDEDKYAFSACFEITPKGKVKDYWLGRTIIRSQRRFTYEEAQDIIEGAEDPLREEVLLLNSLAQLFRRERFAKGAINFATTEVRFTLDETGKPIGVVVKESKEAHQLVEEFMLLANRTVAAHVSDITVKDKPLPFPYRIHDRPDEAKLAQFATFAAKFGYRLPTDNMDKLPAAFNAMLRDVADTPEEHVIQSLGIRVMAKAVYSTENIGHYGLGFADYCHFTSPIRRYPDVLVHRIVNDVLAGKPRAIKGLEPLCRHCSDQERSAMEAERAANKYKQVEFMQQYLGEEFEAVVSGVSSFGFWAETVAHKCEGLISLASLSDVDQFDLHESDYTIIGRHTGMSFRTGDPVKIRVVAASLEKRQLDYELAGAPETRKQRSASRRKGIDPEKYVEGMAPGQRPRTERVRSKQSNAGKGKSTGKRAARKSGR